ncbi:hypothetical protein ACOSP7_026738 [Xanthoceras sorbifolium]
MGSWSSCLLFEDLKKLKVCNFLDRLLWLFSTRDLSFVLQFVYASWMVWNARNAFVFGGKKLLAEDVWVRAGELLAEFELAGKCPSVKSPKQAASWVPPHALFFKLNVDTSVDKVGRRIGAGAVVRDSAGSVVLAASQVFAGGFNAEEAEAKALKEGLLLALDSGCLPLLVESDSVNVVNLCLGASSTRCAISGWICNIPNFEYI